MWLETLSIRNFRGLENLAINFDARANVIVGPNAVGKTTLLEAIRLAKAVLAPRTINESRQTLISLGALSPHNVQNINFRALARDTSRPVEIDAIFKLSDSELQSLDSLVPNVATSSIQASFGGQPNLQGPLGLVQYLSTDAGKRHFATAKSQIETALASLKQGKQLAIKLRVDPATSTIIGGNQFDQIIFSAMEARLPISLSLFSFFPADRAMPSGEVNIQIGGPDNNAQLEAHNSQPQTKYGRLKSTIINNYILSAGSRQEVEKTFEKIFSHVLKDRSLAGININPLGMVSIAILDTAGQRIFDIDSMSSGEKGLILTFLLIAHSISQGGIVLIDEPELHLNPAVCKLILPFLIDEFLVPKQLQAIICSHSPEILGAAFDSSHCSLLHLQSPTVISRIYPEDKREVFDALRRLGTSASDVLFSPGSIFVEGEHDVDILETGFDEIVLRYHLSELGGRTNIEKEIRTLQTAEARREIDTLKCFIFDLDRAPTSLSDTKFIKVLQWKRRCLENYLIDEKIIYDLLNDREISKDRIDNRGEVLGVLKGLAVGQLRETVAVDVYGAMDFENPGLRPKEISGKSYEEIAEALFGRLSTLKDQVGGLDCSEWVTSFVNRCNAEHTKRLTEWSSDWLTLCDGKRFFRELHQTYGLKVSPLKLKKMIVERMRREKTEPWTLVETLLRDALQVSPSVQDQT